jgi:DNA phosphorothioation-dependent restriction protein DptG
MKLQRDFHNNNLKVTLNTTNDKCSKISAKVGLPDLGFWAVGTRKKSLEKFSSSNFELTNSLELVTKFTTYLYLQNLQRNLHNNNNSSSSLKLHFI